MIDTFFSNLKYSFLFYSIENCTTIYAGVLLNKTNSFAVAGLTTTRNEKKKVILKSTTH